MRKPSSRTPVFVAALLLISAAARGDRPTITWTHDTKG